MKINEVDMTTKEKIKKNLDDLPDNLVEQVHQFIKSIKPRNPNKNKIRLFRLKGQFDSMNIRQQTYE